MKRYSSNIMIFFRKQYEVSCETAIVIIKQKKQHETAVRKKFM